MLFTNHISIVLMNMYISPYQSNFFFYFMCSLLLLAGIKAIESNRFSHKNYFIKTFCFDKINSVFLKMELLGESHYQETEATSKHT